MSERGRLAWAELKTGVVTSPAAATLARRLTDAGLAHPRPAAAGQLDVTVVMPFFGPPDQLAGCLSALGATYPVVVVDDGSPDAAAVATVAGRHGATLIRRDTNCGPAAARNCGLAAVRTAFVAFLDSDCRPNGDWIQALAGHFADPIVAAVAPRICVADPAPTYLGAVSTLDLGVNAARVRVGGRVGYVPTAALLARTEALSRLDGPFDEALRYGEDVDLIWRLDAAGWRVRYDPSVEVGHREPVSWTRRAAKRFHYGTSAAPLSRRHPGAVPPLVVAPWPALAVVGALSRRPSVAAAGLVGSTAMASRALRRAGLPAAGAPGLAGRGAAACWSASGRATTQLAAPLVLAALGRRPTESRRTTWQRRATLAAFVATSPLLAYRSRAPHDQRVGPIRFLAGQLLDDTAYGAGVVAGCLRDRSLAPLRPAFFRTTEVT
jgi:mycofactocin system glycosyltransferase